MNDLVERLRGQLELEATDEIELLRKQLKEADESKEFAWKTTAIIDKARMDSEKQLDRLRTICKNIYEVLTGGEEIPLHLLGLIEQMRDEAKGEKK